MKSILQVLGFCLIFIQIDKITNDQIVRFMVLFYLAFVSFTQYYRVNQNLRINEINPYYKYFVLVILIGIFRSTHYSVTLLNNIYRGLLFIVSTIFIYTSLYYNLLYRKKNLLGQLNLAIVIPVGIYILLNILFWILDIRLSSFEVVNQVGEAVMLSNIGIQMQRVLFPLAGGFNTYGDFLGMYVIITLLLVYKVRSIKKNFLSIIGLIIALVSLLLVDSRSFTINALFCVLIVSIFELLGYLKIFRFSQLISFLTPLVIAALIPFLISNNIGNFNLTRSEESGGTFERLIIWTFSIQKLSDFNIESLIGYGEYGHFGSGASKLWAGLFTAWTDSEYISPHNTLLSTIFDYGIIGLIFFIFIIQRSLNRALELTHQSSLLSLIGIAFWLNYFISGASETLNGFYSGGVIYLFEIVIFLVDFEFFKNQKSRVLKVS